MMRANTPQIVHSVSTTNIWLIDKNRRPYGGIVTEALSPTLGEAPDVIEASPSGLIWGTPNPNALPSPQNKELTMLFETTRDAERTRRALPDMRHLMLANGDYLPIQRAWELSYKPLQLTLRVTPTQGTWNDALTNLDSTAARHPKDEPGGPLYIFSGTPLFRGSLPLANVTQLEIWLALRLADYGGFTPLFVMGEDRSVYRTTTAVLNTLEFRRFDGLFSLHAPGTSAVTFSAARSPAQSELAVWCLSWKAGRYVRLYCHAKGHPFRQVGQQRAVDKALTSGALRVGEGVAEGAAVIAEIPVLAPGGANFGVPFISLKETSEAQKRGRANAWLKGLNEMGVV